MSIFDKLFNLNPHNKVPGDFSEEKTTFEPRSAVEILKNQEAANDPKEALIGNLETMEK